MRGSLGVVGSANRGHDRDSVGTGGDDVTGVAGADAADRNKR